VFFFFFFFGWHSEFKNLNVNLLGGYCTVHCKHHYLNSDLELSTWCEALLLNENSRLNQELNLI